MAMLAAGWPGVRLYDKQREIVESVRDNDETFVPAANMMGKDYIAGFILLWFFLTRNPVRIVTTSAGEDHLRVLWGEAGRFIDSCKYPLNYRQGGPLIVNHQELKKMVNGEQCKISYAMGMVASDDNIAKMQGHHANPADVKLANDGIPRTLFMSDESSSVKTAFYTMASTWFKRAYIFGNTWPCENFFKWAVKGNPATGDPGGDIPRDHKGGYYRKIIRIRAIDSPNIKLGLLQEQKKLPITDEILIPGVKSFSEYCKNRKLWDPIKQCVSLDADWSEDASSKMYPQEWLRRCIEIAAELDKKLPRGKRRAKSMGIDCAEGGDDTCWTVIDEYGVLEEVAVKTSDTSTIYKRTLAMMMRWNLDGEDVWFDRGGGGQAQADFMRDKGYDVNTVHFGEKPSSPESHRRRFMTAKDDDERRDIQETKQIYKNRRVEMYGILRFELMDPFFNEVGFGIPAEYTELHRQLAVFPLRYDEEGRIILPPKNNKPGGKKEQETIVQMLGCSPDRADALVLATFGLLRRPEDITAGAI